MGPKKMLLLAQLVNWGIVVSMPTGFSEELIRDSWYGQYAWRWMFSAVAVPSVVFFVGVLLIPESPRWLVKAGWMEQAREVFRLVGGEQYAECDAKAALYEKFKQWDAKTLREQNSTAMRPWHGQNGMPLDCFAMVVRLEGDTITFEDDEGRSFEYDITELVDNDQEYVRGRHSKESQEPVQIALE